VKTKVGSDDFISILLESESGVFNLILSMK